MQEQQEPVQPFAVTLIAALTAVVPLVLLLRGEARSANFLAAGVGVAAGTGLFFQKAWGRWLTILSYLSTIVFTLISWHVSVPALLASILPTVIVIYLSLPGVRALFEVKKA